MIQLYNSKSHKLESFQPIHPQRITMYVCGPTVYGPAHIGNARPAVVFDTLYRLLLHDYGALSVKYASNITDIDDKIIEAIKNGDNDELYNFTNMQLRQYLSDTRALGVSNDMIRPRATHFVPDMIQMISELILKEHAYVIDGQVYFHVPSNPHSTLAKHEADSLRPGDRVAVDDRKKDPRDFVLWKPAKNGEPAWQSPWGPGRPGWHIECSAMIRKVFDRKTIDIHGGGIDLRFPHHDAESAQSQCAHDGAPLANYWVHNGLLTVDGEKMSKSAGNIVLIKDLLLRYPGESVRFYLMHTHYRGPMDWTKAGLAKAHRSLTGLFETIYDHREYFETRPCDVPEFFLDKLRKDLNTPGAIADLHRLAGYVRNRDNKGQWLSQLIGALSMMGIGNIDYEAWLKLGIDSTAVEDLIEQRNVAREAKDWSRADELRDQLAHMGVTVADGAHGTQWRKT